MVRRPVHPLTCRPIPLIPGASTHYDSGRYRVHQYPGRTLAACQVARDLTAIADRIGWLECVPAAWFVGAQNHGTGGRDRTLALDFTGIAPRALRVMAALGYVAAHVIRAEGMTGAPDPTERVRVMPVGQDSRDLAWRDFCTQSAFILGGSMCGKDAFTEPREELHMPEDCPHRAGTDIIDLRLSLPSPPEQPGQGRQATDLDAVGMCGDRPLVLELKHPRETNGNPGQEALLAHLARQGALVLRCHGDFATAESTITVERITGKFGRALGSVTAHAEVAPSRAYTYAGLIDRLDEYGRKGN